MKKNRSVQKTKRILKQTLIDLLKDQSIHQVKVKELTERAEVNRGTFYFHYSDIYDLLYEIEDDVFQELESVFDQFDKEGHSTTEGLLLEVLFEGLTEKREIVYILLGPNGSRSFSSRIDGWIDYHSRNILQRAFPQVDADYHRLVSAFLIRGVIGTFKTWYETGQKQTYKELAEIIEKIIGPKPYS
ncbi:transcriptional regulator, TetR family [Alkalibacterium gilvum]|uniref:Transcriptional regulator, TetR family n=1 Tax=Alkalibacterium gilvum TaxID=1130080 RepID=A0A1H6VSQ4_9LACT|nr:TetR/AcrR family transcriptional regulator [Alkalibacterium gilvum]MDN6397983.1 TetR/AcrR family transcriptional regulator [Alkalibacterium sp.]SEJ03065.1 transcriptional regulator, TetR family [Alkalibacterium gilvum]